MSRKQWDVIFENKIKEELENENKFYFSDMNLLLVAYEQWRYEEK